MSSREAEIRRQKQKIQSRERMSWCLVVVVVILAVVSIMGNARGMARRVDEQREYELRQISKNASYYFRSFLESRLEWMRMFAVTASMTDADNAEEWWHLLESEQSEDYQMGIADATGEIHFGDHETMDVRDREYFKRAMKGESYISRINREEEHENDSVILSVPVKEEDGRITGVLAMEYSTLKLGEYVNNIDVDWKEYGANLVINQKGEIIASYIGMEKYDTIYEMFAKRDLEDEKSLVKMEENVANEKQGSFRYFRDNARRTVFYEPLGINGWTIVSIGAMKSNLPILESIERSNTVFLILFSFIIMLGLIAAREVTHWRMQRINLLRRDDLTKVYRRGAGEEIVKTAFRRGGNRKFYGCIFLDVDNFKQINDTHGHEAGDELLAMLGSVLLSCLRAQDIVYRYGGDEFCVWLRGSAGKDEILEVGKRILLKAEKRAGIHLSMGAAFIEDTETDWQAVMKRADEAVYLAKQRGRHQIALYEDNPEQQEDL